MLWHILAITARNILAIAVLDLKGIAARYAGLMLWRATTVPDTPYCGGDTM